MKFIIEMLKNPLISYWSLAFFAYSYLPYIIRVWKKRVGSNYSIINKRHYLFGYIGLILALLHSAAWIASWTFVWVGIFSLIFIILGTICGYLYKKNRRNKILLHIHSLCYLLGVVLLVFHVIRGW